MRKRKGFTLIELMVVVLIVAVLAAVLIPMISARIEAAKWSEAKAGIGTISTAVRAYAAEKGSDDTVPDPTLDLLFKDAELKGKYFAKGSYTLSDYTYDEDTGDLSSTAPDEDWKIQTVTLTVTGGTSGDSVWSEAGAAAGD